MLKNVCFAVNIDNKGDHQISSVSLSQTVSEISANLYILNFFKNFEIFEMLKKV